MQLQEILLGLHYLLDHHRHHRGVLHRYTASEPEGHNRGGSDRGRKDRLHKLFSGALRFNHGPLGDQSLFFKGAIAPGSFNTPGTYRAGGLNDYYVMGPDVNYTSMDSQEKTECRHIWKAAQEHVRLYGYP